jgi:hypothetical protein
MKIIFTKGKHKLEVELSPTLDYTEVSQDELAELADKKVLEQRGFSPLDDYYEYEIGE